VRQINSGLLLLAATGAISAFAGTAKHDLVKRIAAVIESSPAAQRGRFGYKFVDVETGAVLAQQDPQRFFTPASNTKLYTMALALARLGPNYKFQTELRTNGPWAPGQPVLQDLELIGGGDPNLSGRVLPYNVNSKDGDPLKTLEDLADKLVQAGVHEINGDVTGVSTRYAGDAYPDGWTVDDGTYSYGAPVSALALNDNTISLLLHPTETGELAEVELIPSISHFVVLNKVITDAVTTHIEISRAPGSGEVVVWGTIRKGSSVWREDLGVDDPALLAAEALVSVLRERGIMVRGTVRSRYRELSDVPNPLLETPPLSMPGTLLAVHESAPLWQTIQVVNKVSQNLHAEMLLREVAYVTRGIGTLRAGVTEREAFLEEIGITREDSGVALDDGSGLARQDLTTPDSTVALLSYMWHRPVRDIWVQSLPIGGVDGTLQHRFKNINGAERVHAKTGSLSHVNALSGYIQTERRWIAFSIMVNATAGYDSDARDFIDRLCGIFFAGLKRAFSPQHSVVSFGYRE
jgi:serine-type D-Ala-D-Ala carboxypeptidase/endopeptidase (penicillin-binding protein 4)